MQCVENKRVIRAALMTQNTTEIWNYGEMPKAIPKIHNFGRFWDFGQAIRQDGLVRKAHSFSHFRSSLFRSPAIAYEI
jgi:hypothetical protein